MHRLFLDANVLFTAAHNPEGKAAFLFDALNFQQWQLLSSGYAVEEARRNIAAKFPQSQDRLRKLLRSITVVGQPLSITTAITLPAKDQPIFAAALSAEATHLLTGDRKHFGRYMNQPGKSGGVIIQAVADYLDSL